MISYVRDIVSAISVGNTGRELADEIVGLANTEKQR